MTLPPQGSPRHELRRRIAGCRERLRRNRAAHRDFARAANGEANEKNGGGTPNAADEEDGRRASRLKSIRS